MDVLPDEILLHIFSKLPVSDLICGVQLTCWHWHHLSKDSSLWASIDLSSFKFFTKNPKARKVQSGLRFLLQNIEDSLERLTFSNVSVDGGFYELFGSPFKFINNAKFTHLKCLDYSYSNVSARQLRVALTTHPDIEQLLLSYTKISFGQAMEEAIHLPNLKVLVYHDSHSWDSIMHNFIEHDREEDRFFNKLNVIKVPQHCPLLEVLELHTIRAELDDAVMKQFSRFCPNLRRLSLTWSTGLTREAFTVFSAHHITELGLIDRQGSGSYLDYVLPYFPHLKHLTVNGQNVRLEDCLAIADFCPKLQELIFEINGIRSSGGIFEYYLSRDNSLHSLCGLELQKIAQKCKDLRKLHAPFSNVDDDSLIYLTEQCLFLEDVNLTHCHRLTHESVFALSKNSLCLKKVNFQDTAVDHKFVVGLVTKCHRLEEVVFDHRPCEVESAEGSASSSVHSEDSYSQSEVSVIQEVVSLSQSEDIPFIDMTTSSEEFELQEALFNSLANGDEGEAPPKNEVMESCCTSWTSEVPTGSVDYFPVPCSHCHIKRLSLKHSNADEHYLNDIFIHCPDLTYIALDGCTNLTDNLITSIAKSCPNIRTLNVSFGAKQEPKSKFGDAGLLSLIKYCHRLEVLSFLYNQNVTASSVTALLQSLSGPLRPLESLSLCVGHGYSCSLSVVVRHGLKHLTEQSKRQLQDTAASAKGDTFVLLHLDFHRRKYV